MSLHIVRLGSARAPGEGPRLGTVRRPPRGVPKARWAALDYYDVWLPSLAPSAELMGWLKDRQRASAVSAADWTQFERRFRAELKQGDTPHLLATLALLSRHSDFALGCYCEHETQCHRRVLRGLFSELGARLAD